MRRRQGISMRFVVSLIVLSFPILDVLATMRFARWNGIPTLAWLVASAVTGAPIGPEHQADADDDHWQRQPLSHRKPKREYAEEVVRLARVFDKKTQTAVTDQEQARNRADGSPPSRVKPEEHEQNDSLEPELVELRRVPRHRVDRGEYHRPRNTGRPAP